MNVTLKPTVLGGKIEAIPSKSHAHRLIICASLGDAPTRIICPSTSRDIEATAECMRALGAKIQRTGDGYDITPIDKASRPPHPHLECGESGSTLRFLLPVCAALGGEFDFIMRGRLPEKPCLSSALRSPPFPLKRSVQSSDLFMSWIPMCPCPRFL